MSSPTTHSVIVSCAVTGAIHVPSMTPHLPITPSQIEESAVEAAQAGAAILHVHARDPETGAPTGDPDVFAKFLPGLASRTDAVVNITTGGGHGMSFEERTAAARQFAPELCSINMGSMNFGIFPMARSIDDFQQTWERDYLEMTRDYIFRNTFTDIERAVKVLGAAGTRFEFECYDVGHLHNLAFLLAEGVVEPPLFIQAAFGILGGIGADPQHVMHMKSTADRLFGGQYEMSVLAAGRHQTRLATLGALLGLSVRVGLEDSIYLSKGVLAATNAEQVTKIVRILAELSIGIATPTDVRTMLSLKGANSTALRG